MRKIDGLPYYDQKELEKAYDNLRSSESKRDILKLRSNMHMCQAIDWMSYIVDCKILEEDVGNYEYEKIIKSLGYSIFFNLMYITKKHCVVNS